MTHKKVSWFSAGVSSAVATWIAIQNHDVEIVYIDIDNQHEDSLRFVDDCEKFFNKKIKILKSKYKNLENVIKQFRFINSPYGAKCTQILKKRVRQEYEMQNKIDTYVWGMDCSKKEINRANRIKETMRNYNHIFPLIENNISKENAHGIIESWGIKRPKMYDLGYPNNNCVGCVKGGMGYWNKIRQDFPEVFKRMSLTEREIGASCIKGIFLDELKIDKGREQKIIVPDCGMFCEQQEAR